MTSRIDRYRYRVCFVGARGLEPPNLTDVNRALKNGHWDTHLWSISLSVLYMIGLSVCQLSAFLHPAAFASASVQNQRSPYSGEILVCE